MNKCLDIPRFTNLRPVCPSLHLPYFRTGTPHFWNEEDLAFLHQELNIVYYFDLRTEKEQDRCHFCQNLKHLSIRHISAPVDLTGDLFFQNPNASALDYANYYIRMIPQASLAAQKILSCPTKPGEKILFGCAAGKDRTGLVAMIILKTLGYSDLEILDDYMESLATAERTAIHCYEEGGILTKDQFFESMKPKRYTLEVVLDHIRTHKIL